MEESHISDCHNSRRCRQSHIAQAVSTDDCADPYRVTHDNRRCTQQHTVVGHNGMTAFLLKKDKLTAKIQATLARNSECKSHSLIEAAP